MKIILIIIFGLVATLSPPIYIASAAMDKNSVLSKGQNALSVIVSRTLIIAEASDGKKANDDNEEEEEEDC